MGENIYKFKSYDEAKYYFDVYQREFSHWTTDQVVFKMIGNKRNLPEWW